MILFIYLFVFDESTYSQERKEMKPLFISLLFIVFVFGTKSVVQSYTEIGKIHGDPYSDWENPWTTTRAPWEVVRENQRRATQLPFLDGIQVFEERPELFGLKHPHSVLVDLEYTIHTFSIEKQAEYADVVTVRLIENEEFVTKQIKAMKRLLDEITDYDIYLTTSMGNVAYFALHVPEKYKPEACALYTQFLDCYREKVHSKTHERWWTHAIITAICVPVGMAIIYETCIYRRHN